MNKYYVNKRSLLNGNFSVHKEDCPFLSGSEKRIYLGIFDSCYDAVRAAKKISSKSDGCYFCSKICSLPDKKILHDWSFTFLQ